MNRKTVRLSNADAFELSIWVSGITGAQAEQLLDTTMDIAICLLDGEAVGSITVAADAKPRSPEYT